MQKAYRRLAIGVLSLSACGGVTTVPSDSGPSDAGNWTGELGQAAVGIYNSGTRIHFGTPAPGYVCIDSPSMALRFFDRGPGTYVADEARQACPEPDGGTMLCEFGLEATLGTTPGTGTLKIVKKPEGAWGDFEGEVDLAFPADGGQRTYAFSFVAPVCGIE